MGSYVESLQDLSGSLKTELVTLGSLKTKMESILADINSDIEKNRNMTELLNGLKRSWRPFGERAGKYGPFYCFLLKKDPIKKELDWVFLKDLVEIKQGESLSDGAYGNQVIDDESRLRTDRCPECQKESPVIYRYCQEYDGPDGDWWSTKHLILCCHKMHTIKEDGHD